MEDNWNNIRDLSENYRPQPPAHAWNRVRNKLDRQKGTVRRINRSMLALAASVVGLLVVISLLTGIWEFSGTNGLLSNSPPANMEKLNSADTDPVARMAIDYTNYLHERYPAWMDGRH
jgi:hypothetical protein